MSKNYMVEVNIKGVKRRTTFDDIVRRKMVHRDCGGGKVHPHWHAEKLVLFCKRCGISRALGDNEELRKALVRLMFNGEESTVETVTFIPVGKKD